MNWETTGLYLLQCFSNILGKTMYNCLYKYLTDKSILYKKQFGLQEGHSTEHGIIQVVDQSRNSFDSKQCTLGDFVDLCKAFDTANHKILIPNLQNYGRGKSLINKSNTIHKI